MVTEINCHLCSNVHFSLEEYSYQSHGSSVSGHVCTRPPQSLGGPYLELPFLYLALCFDLMGQISVTWDWRYITRSQTAHLPAPCFSSPQVSSKSSCLFSHFAMTQVCSNKIKLLNFCFHGDDVTKTQGAIFPQYFLTHLVVKVYWFIND